MKVHHTKPNWLQPTSPTLPKTRSNAYAEGTPVKVNCFHGVIRKVITSFSATDHFGGKNTVVPLMHPVYEIELDTSRKYSWGDKRIYLPLGTRTVRLFADEFEPLRSYMLRRAS
jgi:hypothetical protein